MKATDISELENQMDNISKLRQYYSKLSQQLNRDMTVNIQTFGCQMNVHDSEKLKGIVESIGFTEISDQHKADIVIYNTCCIRENAEKKVFGKLGSIKHIKDKNKHSKIILCGCMMQQENVVETILTKYRQVDIVFGTFNLYKLPELWVTNLETGDTVVDIWNEHKDTVEDLPCVRDNKFKASINIMYGCNNFCTYCIVPYVRGRERSREVADIVQEVRNLADDGVKEITLLGQNVNSYGKTLAVPVSFAQLLKQIDKIDGIERIRFMTSHPKDLSDELIEAMRDCKKVCNHIHLPMQSGSSRILEKMNRKYTKEQYLNLVYKIKKAIPDIAITTDIIVGFPTETDADIDDTIDVVEKVKFNGAFTFIYSKRTSTPAAKMENGSSEQEIQARFDRLLKVVNDNVYIKSSAQIGNTYRVLVEQQSKTETQMMSGRAENNSIVHFKGDESTIGKIVNVKIVDCKTFYLIGRLEQ